MELHGMNAAMDIVTLCSPLQFGTSGKVDLDDYEQWLLLQSYRVNTKRIYLSQVRLFLRYCDSQKMKLTSPPQALYAVQQYTSYLTREQYLQSNSLNVIASALQSLFTFLNIDIKLDRHSIHETIADFTTCAAFLEKATSDLISARDRAIVLMIGRLGFSPVECASLNVDDLIACRCSCKFFLKEPLRAEGSPARFVALTEELVTPLVVLLNQRRDNRVTADALFVSKLSERLTPGTINLLIRNLGIRVGLPMTARHLRKFAMEKETSVTPAEEEYSM